jgi:hypothetical protein
MQRHAGPEPLAGGVEFAESVEDAATALYASGHADAPSARDAADLMRAYLGDRAEHAANGRTYWLAPRSEEQPETIRVRFGKRGAAGDVPDDEP